MSKTLEELRRSLECSYKAGYTPTDRPEFWANRRHTAKLLAYQAVYARHNSETVYRHIMTIAAILDRVEEQVLAEAKA